jgi:hypothetical protein
MQTSGRGDRDYTMMIVPFAIFVVYGVYTGGGVVNILRVFERTLWAGVGWIAQLRLFS